MTRNSGFTLMEVLIGMTLLSVMMLLLFGSLRISVRNWDSGEERILEVSEAASVQNFFQRYFTTIRPLMDDFSEDEPVFSFQGESEQVKFVASLPASAGREGLQIFSLKLKSFSDRNSLMVNIVPFFPLADGEEWKTEEVTLADKISQLTFSYYGAPEEGDQAAWHEQWLEKERLPSLIKVEMEFENGILFPELIITPRLRVSKSNNSSRLLIDEDFL